MRREWEEAHRVTEEVVEGPPSKRANATLTACPNGNYLWCIGGEYFSEDGKAYFYNDVFRYSPEKDEWRKFVSPTCPGPRSAHSVAATPAGGGKLFLFGGEFSSLHQNSFHHYRDFWVFDIPTHSWERIETKVCPSARSGHRMVIWKHILILFGGFYDPGYRTRYLNDTWSFDLQDYKWRQIEFKETDRKPSSRSGFSFIPGQNGIVLHGGYCKEYIKGKRPVGVILNDTWLLRVTLNPASATPSFKWEKRRTVNSSHVPSPRAGATMALWSARGMGIMFGGVTDVEHDEEGMESVFWADLFGYQIENSRWTFLSLKYPKKGLRGKKQPHSESTPPISCHSAPGKDESGDDDLAPLDKPGNAASQTLGTGQNPTDPNQTKPMARYNTMLTVLRNTLYIYGGIVERGSREYTLDDFYTIQLDKLDRYHCLRSISFMVPDDAKSSSDDDSGDDDDILDDEDGSEDDVDVRNRRGQGWKDQKHDSDSDEDSKENEDHEQEPPVVADHELRPQKSVFVDPSTQRTGNTAKANLLEVSKLNTPSPGETLAMFYARTREYWAHEAYTRITSDGRGKQLRRDAFKLAKELYIEYQPTLKEIEKTLAEAGLDEREMREVARDQGAGSSLGGGQSRNRR